MIMLGLLGMSIRTCYMRSMKLLAIYFHAVEQRMEFLMPPQQLIMSQKPGVKRREHAYLHALALQLVESDQP